MRSSLALTALATTFAIGSCQFQFQFLHRRQGTREDHAQTSSLFSKISWFWGQDGEVHEQTKTSSIESKDGSQMKKSIVCKDGACTELVPKTQPYAEMHPAPPPAYAEMHPAPPPAYAQMNQPRYDQELFVPKTQRYAAMPPAPPPAYDEMNQLRYDPELFVRYADPAPPPTYAQMHPAPPPSRLRAILDRLYGNLQRQRPEEPREIMINADFDRNEPELFVPKTQPYAEMHPAPPPAYAEMHPAPPPTYAQMHQPPALRGMLDGLIEQMQQQQQPVIMEPVTNMQPPSRLRAILDRLYGNLQSQRPEEPREIVLDADFTWNGPDLTVEQLPPQMQRSPSIVRWVSNNPRPQMQYHSFPHAGQSKVLTVVQVGMAMVAFGAAYVLLFHALKCYRVHGASACEHPLREFSEPLAPAAVNVAIPGAWTCKADPVQMYLSNLYTRANAKNEACAVTTYLGRFYACILA